jgi:ribosomal protein L37E
VEDAPTALERTAEWIIQDDTFTRFECSRCHTKNHHTRWNYCPNCGSLMENKL